jgi:cysteine desulfurase family protein
MKVREQTMHQPDLANERNIVYLDNAATTFPKPESVYVASDNFYRQAGGNAGRGSNPFARTCTRLVDDTREAAAAWLGIAAPEHVVFTASATHALNLAILGAEVRAGDAVYITPFEHNSVLRAAEHLHQTRGISIRQLPFDRRTYAWHKDKTTAMFQSEPPALLCITQASNVCGYMPPVMEIARSAKQVNPQCIVLVDGAQTAGLYPIALQDSWIDGFVFSGHKSLYAPYGIAGLVLGSGWRPTPLLFGGTGTHSERVQMPDEIPSRYEAGSHNIWAIAGLNAALQWLKQTDRTTIVAYTMELARHLHAALAQTPAIEVHVPAHDTAWCGIISLTIADIPPQAIETALGAQNIAVRAGLHCAPLTHQWLGTSNNGGSVRISMGYFNTVEDIDSLASSLRGLG